LPPKSVSNPIANPAEHFRKYRQKISFNWSIKKVVSSILNLALKDLTYPILDSLGRPQNTTVVSEQGLYDLILQSRKKEALKFKHWVTSDILPTIRKTNGCGTPDPMNMLQPSISTRMAESHVYA